MKNSDWALMTSEERYEVAVALIPEILDSIPESSEVTELLGLWLVHGAVRAAGRTWDAGSSSMGFLELATMWAREKIQASINDSVFVTPAERVADMVYPNTADGGAL